MHYEVPLVPALFRGRSKRFSVLADIITPEGLSPTWCHCPNPGRLTSCLDQPGTPLFLAPLPFNPKNPDGLRYRTEQSEPVPGIRVGINPNRANALALEMLGNILPGWTCAGSEVPYGKGSRIDHLFQDQNGHLCYVEVKSVTYKEGVRGLFPDAVSERAIRHLSEMLDRIEEGHRALLLFIVQRLDCHVVAPADSVHPAYGQALRAAFRKGLEVRGARFAPDDHGIGFEGEMPVILQNRL